jgi:hypothetical protein
MATELSPGPGASRPAPREWLAAALLSALLTVALTWPLALRLQVMDPGDSAFFAWLLAWERHALLSDPAGLAHGNVSHPTRFVLGLDEPILGTLPLGLPLWPFTGDGVLVYGVVRLLTYALTAAFTWRLLRELGCGFGPALAGGALFAFSPIRTDQVAHLSTLGTQWLPLLALFLVRYARGGRRRDALLAAVFYALAFLACGYHGVLGLLVWPAFALALLWGAWGRLARALPAVLLAGALLLPLYLLHRAAFREVGHERGAVETARYSSGLESFLAVSPWNRVYGPWLARFRSEGSALFPGLLPLGLALAAGLRLRREGRPPSRESLAFALLAAAGAVVALGPEVHLGGRTLFTSPVSLARELLPPLQGVRAYGRAGIFLAFGLAVLAGRALEALRLSRVALLGLAALGLLESLVVPIPLAGWAQVVDSRQPVPPVYAWLAEQPPGQVVVELPLLGNEALTQRPAFHESIYMLRSTQHWQRLVNGYLGAEPKGYAALRESLKRFPQPDVLDDLRRLGVRYAVVHRAGFGPNQWARLEPALAAATRLRRVAAFGDDQVFELQP